MSPHPEPDPTTNHKASRAWTAARIRALGTVTDIPTTGSIFGLSRSVAYDLARNGQLPVPVLRFGTRYRVPVAAILTALHLPYTEEPGNDLTNDDRHASIVQTQSAARRAQPAVPDRQDTPDGS